MRVKKLLAGISFLLFFTSHTCADGFDQRQTENSSQKQAGIFANRRTEGTFYERTEGALSGLARGISYIAIIIDDIGYSYSRGLQAANLPASLTYSILPYSTHARRLADIVHQSGKEVMVHLPMENLGDKSMGPGVLTNVLSRAEFKYRIRRSVSNVPHATGINNHMGSALTQERLPMEWLMAEIRDLDFFFVDSRTTPKTVAFDVATRTNLLTASRDIFLDNDTSLYEIDAQFRKLIVLAKSKGTAIAIGHPYPETLRYLELALPQLEDEGIRIIPASNLVALRQIINPQSVARAMTGAE